MAAASDVALSTFAVRNSAGEIIGTSGIARDITATRALEHQLIQSQKMEAIGQLTGGIAHDFNNLLAIILGNLELLERTIPADSPGRRRAETAQRAANRCADLTRRLLAFSSREHLTPAIVDLESSVRNTLDMAGHALGPEIVVAITALPGIPSIFRRFLRLRKRAAQSGHQRPRPPRPAVANSTLKSSRSRSMPQARWLSMAA